MEGREMGLLDLFHSVATGPRRRREKLTPLGLLIFGGSLAVVIAGGLLADRWFGLPALLPGIIGETVGVLLLILGAVLCGWCVARFLKARGTPVPLNPPRELIVDGPYARVRNPMLSGVFGMLFGLGLLLHSIGITLLFTPLYLLVHLVELKRVEEPELVRRFGTAHEDYRKQVPMFYPCLRPYRGPVERNN
jgi:protein-S-isoprenylcysteine O-methyltransferase Ste14